jgi:hypothetical protein
MSSANLLSLADLASTAEELPEKIESSDFSRSKCMPVGDYISSSRTITGEKREDGNYSFTVVFDCGLQNEANAKVYGAKYHLKKWISTKPYKILDVPGTTSSVAEYLRAVGFNPKELSAAQVIEAILDSQSVAVGVFVGRTDRRVKDENGTWSGGTLKTKEFLAGVNEDGVKQYAETITKNGVQYIANPVVTSFHSL